MGTSLRRLKIKEVSLCRTGANQKADIILFKSLTDEVQMFDINKLTDPVLRKMVEDEIARINAELATAKAEVVTKTNEVAAATAEVTELKKMKQNPPADPLANLPADVRKVLDDERAKRVELEKSFNDLKAKSVMTETVAYVAKTFPSVGVHSDVAKVIVKLAPEERATLETILSAANTRLEKFEAATKTVGTNSANTETSDDPQIAFDNLVKAEMAKSNVNYAVAMSTVQKSHRSIAERLAAPKGS